MVSKRMADALRQLRSGTARDLAAVCAQALDIDGLAVSLVLEGDHTELVWCSGAASADFEDLQHTMGEGPGPEAIRTGRLVQVTDLRRVRADRWPALLSALDGQAIGSVFCFPLAIGAIRLGVMTAVRSTPRALSGPETDDALLLASELTTMMLDGKGNHVAPEAPQVLQRAVVHQATGMVSVQLEVTLSEALLRMRAHAYGNSRPMSEVAADVVARQLRFDKNMDGPVSPDTGRG